jgi:hypothetical protein
MPPIQLTSLGKRGLQGDLAYRGIYSCSLPYAFAAAFYTIKYTSLARFLQEYHAGQTPAFPTIYSLRGGNRWFKVDFAEKGTRDLKRFIPSITVGIKSRQVFDSQISPSQSWAF